MTRSLCSAVFVAASIVAVGQGAPGIIEGRASDTQQFAVSQATVELQNAQGHTTQRVLSDGNGHYEFASVPPGSYTLRFSHVGFETVTKGPLTVADRQTVILDAILEPQHVHTTVTVVAENDRLAASKTEIPLQDLPVTVQTVPLELIQQQNVTDVPTAISNLPGVNAFTAYGIYEYYIVRGFGLEARAQTPVLLNGLRLEGNRINSQINSVESVEVFKGPSSMLYGTGSAGGLVNIVQKKPLSTPAYEVVLHGGRWDTGGAEFNATGPLVTDVLLYRVGTAFLHSVGFRENGYNRFNLTPELYWRIRPGDQLNLHITFNYDWYHVDAGIPLLNTPQNAFNPLLANIIPNIPLDRRFNTPGNFERANDAVFQVFYEHNFSERVRLRNAVSYRYLNDQYWSSENLSVDPITNPTLVNRSNFYFLRRGRPLLDQTELLASFKALGEHQVLVGYEYDSYPERSDRSRATDNYPDTPISLYNPVETTPLLRTFPVNRFQIFRNLSNAFYFQDYMRLHPKLQLLFGGRYDHFRRSSITNPVINGVETPGTLLHSGQNPFTYRAAMNAQVLPFMSVYASYATGFGAQTVPTSTPLKPETGNQLEVGQRFNFFQNRLSFDYAIYHIIKRNITVERDIGPIRFFDQAGQAHSKGIDAELRGRATQRLQFFANYGFTQAAWDLFITQDGDGTLKNLRGRVTRFTPRHTARLWMTYDFPKGFGASLGAKYHSMTPIGSFNYFFMGGFTTWDTALFYRRQKMELGLNITNLLNKTHYFVSGINETQVYPGKPLNVAATARYRF